MPVLAGPFQHPSGDVRLHELMFDGYRCRPHSTGNEVNLFANV